MVLSIVSSFVVLGGFGEWFYFNVTLCVDVLGNSENPGQTPQSAASDLGLHCLHMCSQNWFPVSK